LRLPQVGENLKNGKNATYGSRKSEKEKKIDGEKWD